MTTYDSPPKTVEEVLKPFSPDIRNLGMQVRAQIHAALPDAEENVYGGKSVANVLYSRASVNDVVCGFQPQEQLVRVFFHNWKNLKEAGYQVEGTGKNARHIKLRSESDFEQFDIRRMIRLVLDAG